MKRFTLLLTTFAALSCVPILFAFDYPDGFREAVEADWARQEVNADRMIDKVSALSDLVGRSEALLERLEEDEAIDQACAGALRQEIDQVKNCNLEELSPKEIAQKYLALRWRTREAALSNPLVKDIPIVFLKEDRYVWQLIHEYL
ncbi:MAG: hypothetical protein J6S75_00645, partial [Thermoguttaceae bacterium]|nr:hypothetical protein [Thermoguttaceae bacterium]